jgi:aryl-alcohol dehydrogenase-like predicted oxidoreductase
MEFRKLGRSGLTISEIAYGNWITHGSQVDEDTARACVYAALDAGITTFDTANVYASGRAEEVLGRALAGQPRDSLVILTKVFYPTRRGGHNDHGLSRKHIHEAVHASLTRLGVEYIDVYQAHRYDHGTPLEETMEAFADLVRAGKVLYVGVSEWTADQIRDGHALARELRIPFVSNQPQYSMLWRVIESDVVPTSEQVGVSQIVWSPIAQGVLSGKYVPGQPAPIGSRAAYSHRDIPRVDHWTDREDLLTRVQRLRPLAEKAGLSMAALAVAWVLQNRNVAAAIVGASRPEQIVDNAAATGVRLDADLMAAVDDVLGDCVVRDPSITATHSPGR